MPVDHLVDGLTRAVTSGIDGVVHFGSGVLTSTTDVAERVRILLNTTSEIQVREIDADVCNVAMGSSRAQGELGWRVPEDTLPALDAFIINASEGGSGSLKAAGGPTRA
jgi:hypothetical protein